jgi:DNA-directed RNA polymerase subunit RPC12/RpoP
MTARFSFARDLDPFLAARHTPARRAIPASETDPHYVCLRCERGEFRLYSSGLVHCAQCGSLMRNLLVRAVPGPSESTA